MIPLAIPFTDSAAESIALAGGKGRNLHLLSAAGFPVPPGLVVTSEAYKQFVAQLDGLNESLEKFAYDDPAKLRQQCAEVRERLGGLDLPKAVSEAINQCFEKSGVSPHEAFAIRSSSTLEDLSSAAFAGQHDTFLNVSGIDSIRAKIRDCFISLWSEHAVLYRRQHGFGQLETAMAVVIQQQIACDVAGVGFSMHPVTGRLDRIVIDANYGLGESVVSGECEVDHFEIRRDRLQVESEIIGNKSRMHVACESGSQDVDVPPEQRNQACLNKSQLSSIAELICNVQNHYGWPQDTEWGIKDGRLYLFQSRPITMFPPRWTREESAERFPNPMTPLSWDFMSEVFNESLAHSLSLMGLPVIQGQWFQWFDNYVYGNQTAVELIGSIRPLKATKPEELVAEIPTLREQYAWVSELPTHWARDLDHYLIEIGRLSAVRIDEASEREIWQTVNELMRVAADYFRPNIAISMTQTFLHRLLHVLVEMAVGDEQSLQVLDGLLAGIETKTTQVNAELHELALLAQRCNELRETLLKGSGKEVLDKQLHHHSPEFAERFEKLLIDHGHREVDIDYCEPTWGDKPAVVLDSIALILRGEESATPAETARQQRIQFAETERQFLSSLPESLRFFFRELIRLTRSYTALDDLEHYQTTRINPIARRAALALGKRFSDRGILDEPGDLFFARKQELEAVIDSADPVKAEALQQAVRAAKQSYVEAWNRSPAWSLEESPYEAAGCHNDDPHLLRGLPGSPGQVTGPCYVVHSPADFSKFPAKAILIARTTNPAWTPLFYSASGLITESGGPLSHGAVTAREMRLPAVMSVRGVMSRLQNGQTVTVNGTQGTIEVG